MDKQRAKKSAHHPERTQRAFEVANISYEFHLLTRKEVAEVLDVSLKVLDRLVRDGQIKCLKISAKVRFRRSEVEAFLTGQAVA